MYGVDDPAAGYRMLVYDEALLCGGRTALEMLTEDKLGVQWICQAEVALVEPKDGPKHWAASRLRSRSKSLQIWLESYL